MKFWDYIRELDIVNLSVTWIEEKGWRKIVPLLPREFHWEAQFAIRDKKKRRGTGGLLRGVKKSIKHENIKKEEPGILSYELGITEEKQKIISIHNREGTRKTLEAIEENIEGDGWQKVLIGGDFNARRGEILWDGEKDNKRDLKDSIKQTGL